MKNFQKLQMIALGVFWGCAGPAAEPGPGPDTSSDTSPDGGVIGADSQPRDGQVNVSDGSDPGYTAPVIEGARVAPAGRDGQHLGIQVEGQDADGDALVFLVRILGANGQEIALFDNNRDGILESGSIALDPGVLEAQFSARAMIKDILAGRPAVAQVELIARDARGLTSAPLQVAYEAQAVRALGESCDPDSWLDRCAPGLGCVGGACQEGQAPRLSRLGYFNTAQGPRILMDGLDPDDDLDRVSLEFLDTAGQPIVVDLDNDETPESSGFEVQARGMGEHGAFFVEIQPTGSFSEQVPQLGAMPYDLMGQNGERVTARLGAVPTQRPGQACDLRGFNTCGAGHVCSPGLVGANNTCQPAAGRRTHTCGRAPEVSLTENSGRMALRAQGASLWNPPEGCAALDPTGRPEAVAKIRLTSAARRLVLSTVQPGTTFDTVLYLLSSCGDEVVACNDDAGPTAQSRLELNNLAAGEYYVVMDAWAEGGVVELEVTVER